MGSATQSERTADEEAVELASRPESSGSLYRVLWRWHFYAGVLISPILLIVTLTGALYIFHSEIEDLGHARLRFVTPEPGASRANTDAIVAAAKASEPSLNAVSLELRAEPNRAAIVRMGPAGAKGRDASPVAVYVDPYKASVVGSFDSRAGDGVSEFFDVVLVIHRQLLAGTTGRILVELTVGWTIVLMVTGVYLWWPKKRGQTLGVWWPRLHGKLYTILRDLHTVLGIYLLAPIAIIVVTGLFYTVVWSEAFHLATRSKEAAAAEAKAQSKGKGKSRARAENPSPKEPAATPTPTHPLLTLEQVKDLSLKGYPGRNLLISLADKPGGGIAVGAANDYNNSYGPFVSAQFEIDRVSGKIGPVKTLAEDHRYWWHGWVYTLHVGSFYGPTTKVIWFVSCMILSGLPITGLWMWWVRRPKGRSGFPRRPNRRMTAGLLATIVGLALILPVLGASMIAIAVGESVYLFSRRRLRKLPASA
ncbi:PepSY-associated TM helix domain-containing protein [Singulisphaera sp. PoT]|uniref:PepSY-associated TM helix domain-containing protein n=1 Tax=Singulisphaera sp. PoT TaxID=3411797 RepID=UPI003BF55857